MFTEQLVVAFMQSYAVIVDKSSDINLSHQSIIMIRMIEFEAKRFHDKNYTLKAFIPIAEVRGFMLVSSVKWRVYARKKSLGRRCLAHICVSMTA